MRTHQFIQVVIRRFENELVNLSDLCYTFKSLEKLNSETWLPL